MSEQSTEIRIKGRDTKVPSTRIGDRTLVLSGKWIKTAAVKDEAHVQGRNRARSGTDYSSIETDGTPNLIFLPLAKK